jgi:hypothetical protein
LAAVALRAMPVAWPRVLEDVVEGLHGSALASAAAPTSSSPRDPRFALVAFLTVLPEEFASPKLPADVRYAPTLHSRRGFLLPI